MIPLTVTVDLDRDPWYDLAEAVAGYGDVERVGLLRHGTSEGRATLALAIRLDSGEVVIAETTLRLAAVAVRALAATPVVAEEDLP